MSNIIFNRENTDWQTGQSDLFLGQTLGLHDSVNQPHPKLFELYKHQRSIDWDETEISLQQSKQDMLKAPKDLVDLMIDNLAYQWEVDSVASRCFAVLLAPFVTNSEFWGACLKNQEMEIVHALTYSEINRICMPDPNQIFKTMSTNQFIRDRSVLAYKYLEDLSTAGAKYKLGLVQNDQDLYDTVFLGYLTIYLVERLQFCSSFSSTFITAENGFFRGICLLVQKIAIDEHDCFSEDNQVLTETGWKYFKDLTFLDKVAQYTEDNLIEFVTPSKIISKDYEGDMYTFSNSKYDQCVTPTHRIIYNKINKDGSRTHSEALAKDFIMGCDRSFYISGYKKGIVADLSLIEKLAIAFQADGSYADKPIINKGQFTNCRPIKFGFSKQRKIERFEQILQQLGFEYKKNITTKINPKYPNRKPHTYFYIKVPMIYEKYLTKDFSWIDFNSISSDYCKAFLKELIHWDGHLAKPGDYSHLYYSNTNKKAVDTVQILATLSGYSNTLTVQKDERSKTFSDVYRLFMIENTLTRNVGHNTNKKITTYKGKVYCCTVPSGMLVTRRNDKVVISGNCHAAVGDYVIRHLIKNDPRAIETMNRKETEIKNLLKEFIQVEYTFNKKIFKNRKILGLNVELNNAWADYNYWFAADTLGMSSGHKPTTPLIYMENWLNIDKVQNANQESDNNNYKKIYLTNDLDDNEILSF